MEPVAVGDVCVLIHTVNDWSVACGGGLGHRIVIPADGNDRPDRTGTLIVVS